MNEGRSSGTKFYIGKCLGTKNESSRNKIAQSQGSDTKNVQS